MTSHSRLFSFLFFVPFLFAGVGSFFYGTISNDPGICAQDLLLQNRPDLLKRQQLLDKQYAAFFGTPHSGFKNPKSVVNHTLPVVVHIIHDGGPENISDATILQGIEDLNAAFANIGYYDPTTGVDTEIQFCLAKRTPDGNATTGINHIQSPLTELTLETDDIDMKNLSRWEPNDYINIWLVREICSSSAGCGVAGYAYLPSSHGDPEDGLVIEANWFGSSPASSSVIAHEMGHYLGLYHTFEGGCTNADCLADGDLVCDTPPDQSTAPVPCNGTANSCNTDTDSGFATDQNDMFWNFMDYGDWGCYSDFTQGQADRMDWHIENVRASLLNSFACTDPCSSPLTASFSSSSNTVVVGGSLSFVNTSTNATSAEWAIDGTVFSNAINASYTVNTVGFFEICLNVGNADPNCLDRTCQTFSVTCPVQPAFTTSGFYPLPGQTVNYTNQSINATSFEWQVDGLVQGTTTDFSFSFPTEGTFDVCLVAANGLCEAAFCLPVFVTSSPPPPSGCDSTFLRVYGTPNLDEFGYALAPMPGGGLIIGGGKGPNAMLSLLDENENLIWTRDFNPTSDADDYIWEIKTDSDGKLIGVGQTRIAANNIEVFAFRYNLFTDNFDWLTELDIGDPAHEGYFTILENGPGGNFFIAGQVAPNGTNCNGLLIEVDRNTGLNNWGREYNLGQCETFYQSILVNNVLYHTGRYTAGNALDKYRPGITQTDLSGNQIWSNLYLVPVAGAGSSAKLLSTDLIFDNGPVVYGYGDKDGTSDTEVGLFLFKTTASGNLDWAKEYTIFDGLNARATRVVNLPDGYLCLGNFDWDQNDRNIFIFKTDKTGNLLWAKQYSGPGTEEAFDMVFHNNLIYFTGLTKGSVGPSEDILLAKLTLNGEPVTSGECDFFADLNVTAADFPDPYEGSHPLSVTNTFQGFFTNSVNTSETSLLETFICETPCADSCDLRPDAVFQSAFGECDGDSLLVTITFCNSGNVEIPAGTPFSVYGGDPTLTNVPRWRTDQLPHIIKRDSCLTVTTRLPSIVNAPFFIMCNDDGMTFTPFSLTADFPNTSVIECDYTNNIGSFQVDFTPPPLDLGPDIVACDNAVTVLDAGPGFLRYIWQDGSEGQTFTATGPGVYIVEVTDSCGGTQADGVDILIDPATVLDLGPDTLVCEGDSLLVAPTGFTGFEWFPKWRFPCGNCPTQTLVPQADSTLSIMLVASNANGCFSVDTLEIGATLPVFTYDTVFLCPNDTVFLFGNAVAQPGNYSGTFPRPAGCDSTHQTTVRPIGNLLLQLPEDMTIELGDSVVIKPVTNGTGLVFSWSPPDWLHCNDCERPISRPKETVLYTLVVKDGFDCEARDEILLTILKTRKVYVPNVFSPNGDGLNDTFYPFGNSGVTRILDFKVFDRWGELVFEQQDFPPNDPGFGWDGVFRGKEMNPAVFVWLAKVEFFDGEVILMKGDVTLAK